jgi:hypothetical protein
MEQYNGEDSEKAKITIVDKGERFLLQMNVDSGYFRGFCNALRTGDPTAEVRVKPNYQVVDGKKKSTCFVEQNGKALKHAFTRENPGELPPVEKVMFKGKEAFDGSKAMTYWKNWLNSIKWAEVASAPVSESAGFPGNEDHQDDPF